MKIFLISVILIFGYITSFAQILESRKLPVPQTDRGIPLMKALKERKTSREFSTQKLPDQLISDLLWAADGINRAVEKKRTAPSAMNYQETDIYIAASDGLFLYNATEQSLIYINKNDIRSLTGKQEFVKDAPLTLVYVADYTKMGDQPEQQKDIYAAADAAFISENVYLFCASEGLATGVRAYVDKETLAKAMGIKTGQHIIFAQSVGYPVGKK
ncbi:MAG: nitroreductase family protein [Bacteroidia bacterium]|nr:nitroreductase family protein [Bacteroidia bacterium]